MNIEKRALGVNGPSFFPMALGCMGMSGMYGATDEAESIATIHAAIDRGVTLLDTGDFFWPAEITSFQPSVLAQELN